MRESQLLKRDAINFSFVKQRCHPEGGFATEDLTGGAGSVLFDDAFG